MLSTHKKKQASEIAKILATEGMLFGKELEEYIKLNEIDGIIRLDKENEMDEFIDEVIKKVEMQWRKAIVVYDKEENITQLFFNADDLAREINTSKSNISRGKRIKNLRK